MRVKQESLAAVHCILIAAERGKTMRDKILERLERISAADRQVEIVQATGTMGKFPSHHGDHLGRRRVRREAWSWRDARRSLAAKGLAIVGVKVPLSTHWFAVALQHNAAPTAHGAIEGLQYHV